MKNSSAMSSTASDQEQLGIGKPQVNPFMKRGKSLVSKVSRISDLKESISASVEALGGFERIIDEGEKILVKPNFNTADPPPASSDPDFVKAVIELLYEHGAGKVILGESSTFSGCTRRVFEETGMTDKAGDAEIVFFEEGEYRKITTGGRFLKKVSIPDSSLKIDKLVNVSCIKTHQYATFTLSLKNAVGFMKRNERLISLHTRRLEEKIADLNLIVHPVVTIMDGRKCFISGGPACGELREPGVILASGDRVAIDVEAIKIMQGYKGSSLTRDPWRYKQVTQAVQLGLGSRNEEEYTVIE